MDTTQAFTITGNSGKKYSFFPCYKIDENDAAKGEGIYLFFDDRYMLDIQYLSDDKEVEDTINRLKDDGATYFYFKAGNDRLEGDADIDDIKTGEEYRKKID